MDRFVRLESVFSFFFHLRPAKILCNDLCCDMLDLSELWIDYSADQGISVHFGNNEEFRTCFENFMKYLAGMNSSVNLDLQRGLINAHFKSGALCKT